MNDGLKKVTIHLDKATGESRTLILVGERITQGNITRLLFNRTVTVLPNETMRITEEDIDHPGIVGMKADRIIIDDFSLLETRMISAINDLRNHEVKLVEDQTKCWHQGAPYGKKSRRRNRG